MSDKLEIDIDINRNIVFGGNLELLKYSCQQFSLDIVAGEPVTLHVDFILKQEDITINSKEEIAT